MPFPDPIEYQWCVWSECVTWSLGQTSWENSLGSNTAHLGSLPPCHALSWSLIFLSIGVQVPSFSSVSKHLYFPVLELSLLQQVCYSQSRVEKVTLVPQANSLVCDLAMCRVNSKTLYILPSSLIPSTSCSPWSKSLGIMSCGVRKEALVLWGSSLKTLTAHVTCPFLW